MNVQTNFLNSLDVFDFNYSDGRGELSDYVIGKSIANQKYRYVSGVSINPNNNDELRLLQEFIYLGGPLKGKTIGIDYRLLNDKVIQILKRAYESHLILGIRILPSDVKLTKEAFDKLNQEEFSSMLISVYDVEKDVNYSDSQLDFRVTKGICTYEHIQYDKDDVVDHYNAHVIRKLDKEEIKYLVGQLNITSCNRVYLDFYDPSYYKTFLETLKESGLSSRIEIVLLGNPLTDSEFCYSNYSSILSNPIQIRFNTCDEINDCYSDTRSTEGITYYSEIECSGIDNSHIYIRKLHFFNEMVHHIKVASYSPLEAVCYVDEFIKDYFKEINIQDEFGKIHTSYEYSGLHFDHLADIYSIVLRKLGISCFTYDSGDKRKNILRIRDPKYRFDQIALIDSEKDMKSKNRYNNFLVALDNDIYNQNPEVINIPTSLVMASSDYYANMRKSNPMDPIENAIRVLQLMGLGHGNKVFANREEEIEFYKTALANSNLMNEVSYLDMVKAFQKVRMTEHKNMSENELKRKNYKMFRDLQTRGNDYYVAPAIRLDGTSNEIVDVDLFKANYVKEERKTFSKLPIESVSPPRRKKGNEFEDDYQNYLVNFYNDKEYKKIYMNEGMKNMKDYEEYVVDDLKVNEMVFYRDVEDSGRLFANKSVFDRFHLETPKYVIEMDNGEKIYELKTSDAIDIINNANNAYSPYLIRYCYIAINEEENYRNNDVSTFDYVSPKRDKFIFYRNINDPEKLYVRKEVFDRFRIEKSGTPVIINGIECFEITNEDVLYITGNAKNKISPYDVEERGIPLDRRKKETKNLNDLPYKEKFIIYRNIDHPEMLYVRKELFKRFRLDTDVEEVSISGIPCYVIDRGDLSYIIGNANNVYSPYEIEYRDVKLKTTNIKPADNNDVIDIFRVYRNTNAPERWYADKKMFDRFKLNTEVEEVEISGIPCYVIDEKDLAYILGNANNKYAPYKVEFVDLSIKSEYMKPGENKDAVNTMVMYRNTMDPNMYFVRQDVFKRFRLQTEVEDIRINGELFYVIDPNDLEYIIGNANNKYSPYKIEFKDIPVGNVKKKCRVHKEETAKDLVDSQYVPGTNLKKPRERLYGETDEEYIDYLRWYYDEFFGNHYPMVKK